MATIEDIRDEASDVFVDPVASVDEALDELEEPQLERTAASLSSRGISAEDLARCAAQAAYDKKAEGVQVMDLTSLSDVCDYFVLATGLNNRQADTIVDEIEEKVAEFSGEHPFSIEGREERAWILMDYGSVIVHVFTPEARDYYRLEKLWGEARELELNLL